MSAAVSAAATPQTHVSAGYTLPPIMVGPITRRDLALYAGASGDDNPAHIDFDFALRAGMDDVFAHGMLSMAYLGRLLTNWVRPDQISDFSVRFLSITPVNAYIVCTGVVDEVSTVGGRAVARVALTAATQEGVATLAGSALVSLDAS